MSDKEWKTASDDQLCAYMALLNLEYLSRENLKANYRSLIKAHHVDKGGDAETNRVITQAYRVLNLCLDNGRTVGPKKAKSNQSQPGPSKANANFQQYQEYANGEDSWMQYKNSFVPRQKKKKAFFKPSKFDRAFDPNRFYPDDDADDPINSDIGKARSKPKKYNNGYTYESDDEFIPNDRQSYSAKNDGEPRVIRGGLEIRKPLNGIELPENYERLSQSELKLNELSRENLLTNPDLSELYELLDAFRVAPSFETLMQRTRTFIYLDWAQSNQSDTTQYQNIAVEQRGAAVSITLPQFEEDDIVDDRLKEGVIIELFSCEDITLKAKATVDSVDWETHKIAITFTSTAAGERLINSGHRCNISMAPSRFIYKAFIRGLNYILQEKMIDYVYPDPEFDEPFEDVEDITEQRIADRVTHEHATASILFNHLQEAAIDTIVNGSNGPYPFLLFGPPGTGKTATLVECLHRITKLGKEKRILVCTPTNKAADVIATAILQRDFIDPKYVFRLNSLSSDYKKRNRSLDPISCIVKEASAHAFGIPPLRNLQVYRIIITTLTSSVYLNMAAGLRGYFSHILIDEAAQATEQEAFIPIGGLAVKQQPNKPSTVIALFGDPHQLGAVDRIPVLKAFGYGSSTMERLSKHPAYQSGDRRLFVMLEQNYRTHGLILRPASRLFYNQRLNSINNDPRLYAMCGWEELPNPGFPLIFHSTRGSREIRSTTCSYKNHYEMDLCVEYIKKLQKHGIQLHEIGVISPYKFQMAMVKEQLEQHYKMFGVTVNSVEGFQGSERKVIIFLTTRTNTMGFLSCDKRLNTSITRAQQLLIILGDEELLKNHVAWDHFIHYCKYHNGFKKSALIACADNEESRPHVPVVPDMLNAPPPGFEHQETPASDGVPVNLENHQNNTDYHNYQNYAEQMNDDIPEAWNAGHNDGRNAAYAEDRNGWHDYGRNAEYPEERDAWRNYDENAAYREDRDVWHDYGRNADYAENRNGWHDYERNTEYPEQRDGWRDHHDENAEYPEERGVWHDYERNAGYAEDRNGWYDYERNAEYPEERHAWHDADRNAQYYEDRNPRYEERAWPDYERNAEYFEETNPRYERDAQYYEEREDWRNYDENAEYPEERAAWRDHERNAEYPEERDVWHHHERNAGYAENRNAWNNRERNAEQPAQDVGHEDEDFVSIADDILSKLRNTTA